jgi:hypothetical protein
VDGRPKEHVYAVPVRAAVDLVARIPAATITVAANMSRNAARRTAVCREMDGCAPLRKYIVFFLFFF